MKKTERRDGFVSWTKSSRHRRVRSSTELFQEPLCGRGRPRARSVAIEVVRDRGGRDVAFGAGKEKAFACCKKKQKPRHLSGACVLVRHGWTIISRISPRVSPPVTMVSSPRRRVSETKRARKRYAAERSAKKKSETRDAPETPSHDLVHGFQVHVFVRGQAVVQIGPPLVQELLGDDPEPRRPPQPG